MNQLNIFDEVLHECCSDPLTGFFRDGFCNTNEYDQGLHIVCCLIDDNFLQFSFDQGNDLITPKPEFNFQLNIFCGSKANHKTVLIDMPKHFCWQ